MTHPSISTAHPPPLYFMTSPLLQYRDAVSKHASRSKYTLSQLMNFDSRFMSEGQFSHKQKSVKRQQHTKEIQDFV